MVNDKDLVGGGRGNTPLFEREVQEGDDIGNAEAQWVEERQEGLHEGE